MIVMPKSFQDILDRLKGEAMSKNFYTIGEIADAISGGNESTARKLLNDAGANPRLVELANNPSEIVSRKTVIDLLAMRAGDRVGRKLGELLRE